jgi:hypothetical protein
MRPSVNMPILYQNIMSGLPSDFARDAFLFAAERTQSDPMLYKAEAFALEAERLAMVLTPMLDAGAKQHHREAHDRDLMRFILTRHANWRFGGNVSPSYAGAA